jgi:hypothetical protein
MPPKKGFAQATKDRRNRIAQYRRSLFIEHEALVKEMRAEAERLTSGSVKTRTLRRIGHPFSRRRPMPGFPRLPINEQSGQLRRSIRLIPMTSSDGRRGWRLQYTSPHAIVLKRRGTKNMVARGFWTAMRRHYVAQAKKMEKRTGYAARLAGLKRKYARHALASVR